MSQEPRDMEGLAIGASSPVDEEVRTDSDTGVPRSGIGLCLSGGGYRAMLFHMGTLWRLRDANLLPRLDRISSVSGGSIASAMLGMHWNSLVAEQFEEGVFMDLVVAPIRRLAEKTIDIRSVVVGALFGSAADRLADAYREHLFGSHTLQDLPTEDKGPRFVINATNVQTMALWRFMQPYMADYTVGKFLKPKIELAVAVAASSAFPPVLSPLDLHIDEADLEPSSAGANGKLPFTRHAVLTDGGVYDNLGLETVWKRFVTVLVSDGGGKVSTESDPEQDWARHSLRIFEITDNQVRSLRKRQVIDSIVGKKRYGAYWGIRDDVSIHGKNPNLPCPYDRTRELSLISTRLKALDAGTQERLINWGYAVCDASLNRWYKTDSEGEPTGIIPATKFPYSGGV